MIKNHALRNAIQAWREQERSRPAVERVVPESSSDVRIVDTAAVDWSAVMEMNRAVVELARHAPALVELARHAPTLVEQAQARRAPASAEQRVSGHCPYLDKAMEEMVDPSHRIVDWDRVMGSAYQHALAAGDAQAARALMARLVESRYIRRIGGVHAMMP